RKSKSSNQSHSKAIDVETKMSCGKCGKSQYPADKCPAKDNICRKCSKKGHYATVCRSASGENNPKKSAPKPRLSTITARIARIERSPRVQIMMKPNHLKKQN
ncbi:hypothetical protein LOTGIDRAFT_105111, partial [Lottia gigantea]